jgi:hypothetical protein
VSVCGRNEVRTDRTGLTYLTLYPESVGTMCACNNMQVWLQLNIDGSTDWTSLPQIRGIFLPSADYEVVAKGLGITFCPHPFPPSQTLLKSVTKKPPGHIWWPMTHYTNMLKSVTYVTSVTPMTCVTLWQNVTLRNKKADKIAKNAQICHLGNKIEVTHCDTIFNFDKYVTPKVFKFSGPSNDGRRHGRGTYLFILRSVFYI